MCYFLKYVWLVELHEFPWLYVLITGSIMLLGLFGKAHKRHKYCFFTGHTYQFYPLQATCFLLMHTYYYVGKGHGVNRHILHAVGPNKMGGARR